ncbi:ATP-binding protein [Aquabacterium sp.]|uniref:ATP-binding protein n=1 Tax=Aquabacterium sp. TaxID=1872578 RepID=UPI002C381B56|nr:tetratricopeptide repeat protein [Aquabacterium sp.]HSW04103.1 tetratricopeptide repeat protein [Aquabacterium sp.]
MNVQSEDPPDLALAEVRWHFGAFILWQTQRRLERAGQLVRLGPRSFDLLLLLVQRAGEFLSKDELLATVWAGVVVEQGSVRVHMSMLRKALGEPGDKDECREWISNVPQRGYRFNGRVRHEAIDAGLAASRPPPQQHNLPCQLTSFIGREAEIHQLKHLFTTTRLLTLTGAGGCGKTRLALQVAGEVVHAFPEGCWLVELAPLGDPALVAQTVAQTVASALAVKEQGSGPLDEAMAQWLAAKRLLLVLDNAEHVLERCAALADSLLRRCAGLRILVTSREPLGVRGELTYRVPSLSAEEAARLFIERARLHRPDFEITSKNADTLASVCRRLDGIALAIELAAPRTRTMSIEELERRLDDRFGLLNGGHRTALPRHRTLRSLIDWSHDLLSAGEKAMLRRAAAFSGGVTVDAAEAVCTGDGVSREEVFDLLTSLTDKNLLVAETHDDATRFGMLETVRHYAREQLRESGEEVSTRARHLAYCLSLAERLDGAGDDAQRQLMLGRMDLEHDNVRGALAWSETSASHAAMGLRLAGKLEWFWRIRSRFAEGVAWATRLLAAAGVDAPAEDRGVAHHAAGVLAYHQGDCAAAEVHQQQALAMFQDLGQRDRVARALGNLGSVALLREDFATARQCYEQALALARALDDRRSIALGLQCLGLVARDTGDLAGAEVLLEEGIAVARELGPWSAADLMSSLAQVKQVNGDLVQARALLMEVLAAERAFGNDYGVAMTLVQLAELAHDRGDMASAKTSLREALAIVEVTNARMALAYALEVCGPVALAAAGPRLAVRLFGAAERFREEVGAAFNTGPLDRPRHEGFVAAARDALNDGAAFDRSWNEGRSMTLAEAVHCAQDMCAMPGGGRETRGVSLQKPAR